MRLGFLGKSSYCVGTIGQALLVLSYMFCSGVLLVSLAWAGIVVAQPQWASSQTSPDGMPPNLQLGLDRGALTVQWRQAMARDSHWSWTAMKLSFFGGSRPSAHGLEWLVPGVSNVRSFGKPERRISIPLAYLFFCPLGISGIRHLRKKDPSVLCDSCRYPLSGLPSNSPCPECGKKARLPADANV